MQEFLRRFWFLLMVILAVSLALPSKAFAQSDGDLSPAEQWVLEQVALGRIADLDQPQFSNKEDRVLRADFLVKLLENPAIEITRYGIRIQHAVFEDPLQLAYIEVDHQFWLEDCEFKSDVNLYESHFTGDVYFRGSTFLSAVDLRFLEIGENLVADNAKFINEEQTASFNSITVGGSVLLSEAEFAGPVDFIRAQVGSNFEANEAKFTSTEQTASFNSMKVDGLVSLQGAEFAGPVDFIAAQVGSNFEANEAKFTSTASFNSMTVGGIVFLHGAEFAGPVDFIRAQIGSNLEAKDARFNNKNKEQKVNFESMKVDGHIFLNRVVFAGPVNFDFVEVKNNFDANNAKFLNTDGEPSFKNMIVRQEASFVGTIFEHGADFDNAVFLDLTIRGEAPNPIHILDLRLSQTLVERKLNLESLEIQNLYCTSLVVYGLTNIKNVNFVNSADFENSQFGGLHVENVSWTPGLKNINLGGMSYQNIQMILEPNKDAWEELIDLIDRSTYNAQAYTTLENYFLQQGYADRADEVYIRYKQREFREGLRFGSMGWWSNLFLKSVGYGRKPGFVLVGALLFILIGWLGVFRKPEGMVSLSKREIVRPNVGHRGTLSRKISQRVIFSSHEGPYSPFWYSLDLFIPFVDLGFDDKWAPRPNRQGALLYAKVHMLAGWILIPIGLLAITGVIK